jgi:SAM-dependent methyltransferase
MTDFSYEQPKFSHVGYATDYMQIAVARVVEYFGGDIRGKLALDLPAGNGWVSDRLRDQGAEAVSADINEEKSDFVQVDMEQMLPFEDAYFDIIVCCEGIEHVFSPFNLFSEFARVLKKGGILVITTPNVQNLYSRWQFLCTGYLFQFDPFNKIPLADGMVGDKGHISPVTYGQLQYYAEHFKMIPSKPTGGRFKRIILLPLLAPVLLIGLWWNYRDWMRTSRVEHRKQIIKVLFNARVLLSRSLVFVATR